MNQIDGAALDRYITGNYGEDQYSAPPHNCRCECHEDSEADDCPICVDYHVEMSARTEEMERDYYQEYLEAEK